MWRKGAIQADRFGFARVFPGRQPALFPDSVNVPTGTQWHYDIGTPIL